MRVIQWVFVFGLLMIVGCVTTIQQAENSVRPGMKFSGSIAVGVSPMRLPLPDGEWEVASTYSSQNNHNVTIFSAILFQEKNNELHRALYFQTPLSVDNNGLGYVNSKLCSRDDMHYRNTFADTSGGKQDCEWVVHYRVTLAGSKNKINNEAGVYLKANGITYPNHLIQVGNRIADELTFLNYNYYFNPAADGFVDSPRTTWSGSPWHPQAITTDNRKSQYISEIIEWGKDWHQKVKAGFSGKLAPKYASQSKPVTSTPNVSKPSGATSDRLTKLKGLYEKKLITKDEYDRMKQDLV